jgi:hypothetical protein
MSMNDWRSNAPFPLPDLSPRAAPATGPRVESAPIDLSEIPTAAEVALNPPRFDFKPAASPPPEPAEERNGCVAAELGWMIERAKKDGNEGDARRFDALRQMFDAARAPALPRPEGHVHGPGCTTGECGVCGTWHCMAHLKPGAKWLTDLADCPGPAASAPPPRPEESAEFARGRKAGIEEAARHLRERCCGRWDVQFIASELEAYIRRHPDLRALSAPPPGEERLREALSELRQQVEDTVLVATTDTDDEGWITAYHFKTGAIHRLIAKARGPIPSALRAALREDEKGAKP